jgi:hypothetical protein
LEKIFRWLKAYSGGWRGFENKIGINAALLTMQHVELLIRFLSSWVISRSASEMIPLRDFDFESDTYTALKLARANLIVHP